MLTKIHIKHFRCLREIEMDPLKRVNLVIGQNSTGKTALLEALRIVLADPIPGTLLGQLPTDFRAGVGASNPAETFWKWLFFDKNDDLSISIHVQQAKGGSFELRLHVRPLEKAEAHQGYIRLGDIGPINLSSLGGKSAGWKAALFSTKPNNPLQDAVEFNRVVLKRRKKELVTLLKPLESRLEALEAVHTSENFQAPLICADLGLREMIPVIHLGQGFCRLLSIFTELLVSDSRVLLIDEIENGIHYGVLPVIWKGLFHASREIGVQIFATTHSRECILAADKAAREAESYDLSLVRLDRVEGDVKATVMDGKTLDVAKEFNWELR